MFTRRIERNENTAGVYATLRRAYCVPTEWTPPMAKAAYDPRYGTVTMLFAPTPGAGDPRNAGENRVVNPTLRKEMHVQ